MQEGAVGIMTWFCWNKDPATPKLFLAFEPKKDFKYPKEDPAAAQSLVPEVKDLIAPSIVFSFPVHDIVNHETFLKTHTMTPPISDVSVPNSSVRSFVSQYISDGLIKLFQKYGHGYFEDLTEGKNLIQEFLAPPEVKYIRYYLGFDPMEERKPNSIRFFLVPVDATGKNIAKFDKSDATLLQKSWPPPPSA